jgi:uncharacterized membrane protein YkvA (DUF1232 family)
MRNVGELRKTLKSGQISPERYAKRVGLSHMTIRRWLKQKDSTRIPQKYLPLLREESEISFGSLIREFDPYHSLAATQDPESLKHALRKKMKETSVSEDFAQILKIVSDHAFGNASLKSRLLCIAALLYFVSPIDLIPDATAPLGLIDDFAILSLVASQLISANRKPSKNGLADFQGF